MPVDSGAAPYVYFPLPLVVVPAALSLSEGPIPLDWQREAGMRRREGGHLCN